MTHSGNHVVELSAEILTYVRLYRPYSHIFHNKFSLFKVSECIFVVFYALVSHVCEKYWAQITAEEKVHGYRRIPTLVHVHQHR